MFTRHLSTIAVFITLFAVLPSTFSMTKSPYDWDTDWLQQTHGGFINTYPYDSSTFYQTLPSNAKSFALHPYTRNTYYQYYHDVPAPPGYESPMSNQDISSCSNYTFKRAAMVPPFGYRCQGK